MKNSNNQRVSIILNGVIIEVTKQIIENNFQFIETFRKKGNPIAINRKLVVDNIKDYTELLKKGKIRYFNPTLGISYPTLSFEEGLEAFHRVRQYCIDSGDDISDATITILGVVLPTLIIKSSQERCNMVKHYCIANNIYIVEGRITL